MEFDFISDLGANLTAATRKRQEEQLTQASVAASASREVNQLDRAHSASAEPVQRDILKRRQAAENARALMDSGKFSDRLKLANLQLTDPGNYRPDLRQARTAEDVAFLQGLSVTKNVHLQELQSRLAASSTGLDIAAIEENLAFEQFEETAKIAGLMRDRLTSARELQEAQIGSMSPEEIRAGMVSPDPVVSINGIDLPRHMLEQRHQDLDDRKFARDVQRILFAQSQADRTQGQAESDRQIADALYQQAQQYELQTMQRTELQDIRSNGYVNPTTGTVYPPEQVDRIWAQQTQASADAVTASLEQNQIQNQLPTAISNAAQQLTHLAQTLPANSLLQPELRMAQQQIGQAQIALGANQGGLASAHAAIAMESYQQAALNAARRDSFGDKNLETALQSFYTTGFVDVAQVAEIGVERLTKNRTLNNVLPADLAVKVQQSYNRIRQELLQAAPLNQFQMERNPTAAERKELDAQAAQQAMAEAGYFAGGVMHESAVLQQFEDATHPLHGRVSAQGFAQMQEGARQSALSSISQSTGVDVGDLLTILETGEVPQGLPIPSEQALRTDLNYFATLTLQEQFSDSDLRRWLQWQDTQSARFVEAFHDRIGPQGRGFASSAANSLGKEWANNRWTEYAAFMGATNLTRTQQTEEAALRILSNSEPLQMQAIALGAASELNQTEKNQLFPHIAEVVQQVQNAGIPDDRMSEEIRQRFSAIQFDDPTLARIARRYSANWEDNEKRVSLVGTGIAMFRLSSTASLLQSSRDLQTRSLDPRIEDSPAHRLTFGSRRQAISKTLESMEHYNLWNRDLIGAQR